MKTYFGKISMRKFTLKVRIPDAAYGAYDKLSHTIRVAYSRFSYAIRGEYNEITLFGLGLLTVCLGDMALLCQSIPMAVASVVGLALTIFVSVKKY